MTDRVIHHHLHGGNTHDLCIFLAERMIIADGHELRPGSIFKDKHRYPGDADIYCLADEDRHDGPKLIKGRKSHIVEMESDLSKAAAERKHHQFEELNSGCELTIINLADLEGAHDSISELEAFIAKRLLFVKG